MMHMKRSVLPRLAAFLLGASTLVYSCKGPDNQVDLSDYVPREELTAKHELLIKKNELLVEKNEIIIKKDKEMEDYDTEINKYLLKMSSTVREKCDLVDSYKREFQRIHDRYKNDDEIISAAGYSVPSNTEYHMNLSLHMYKKKVTVNNKIYDCSFYEKSNGLVNILTLSNHEGTKKFICMDDNEVNIFYVSGEEILSPKPNGTIYSDKESSRNVTDTLVLAQEMYEETIEEIVAMNRGDL